MSDGTKIEWTDATWNPVSGCTKVSDGCTHCYIDRTPPFRMAHRRFQHPDPIGGASDRIGATTGVQLHPERLVQPLSWRKPRRVFVCSLADLFHEDVPVDHIARVWATMALAPQHTFQVLTKRHARLRALLSTDSFAYTVTLAARMLVNDLPPSLSDATAWRLLTDNTHSGREDGVGLGVYAREIPWPLPNVWVGVSAESQQWADARIPALLDTPAAVRWVSAEPLLGELDLGQYLTDECGECQGVGEMEDGGCPVACDDGIRHGIDWVVAGGESGPGARPMHRDWAGWLLEQCSDARSAFLFKQWGEHDERGVRVGKKAAGRVLAGRTHDGYPVPATAGAR